MKDLEPPRQMRARTAIALAYFTGITLIVGWSLPEGAAAHRRAEPAMRVPDTGASGATAAPARSTPVAVKTRGHAHCVGCGVIEAVLRIDVRDAFAGSCDAGEMGRPHIGGNVFAGDWSGHVPLLADTVGAVIAYEQGVKKVAVTTRHQIVVRLRDGTRHVFDEATPRTLRVGDRFNVIAGAAGANG